MKKLRILIVDDSASVRQGFSRIIGEEPDLEVMGVAADPLFAAERIRHEVPDVILCDVEMPRMDGITFVRRIMAQRPIPVVICSSLTEAGSETALRALEAGAVEVVAKPRLADPRSLEESRAVVCDKLRAAARARLGPLRPGAAGGNAPTAGPRHVEAKLTADAVLPPPTGRPLAVTTDQIVVVGASTGGTEALKAVLAALPPDAPGVVVVQHMPAKFTAAFAKRLDQCCAVTVREASDRDRVLRGQALIAPGDHHLLVQRSGAQYLVEVRDGPLVSRHRPSVDVLFRSAARAAGSNALGVIMTGMGDDGAKGLLELRQSGAATLGQDEATCVVYGMPKEAAKLGAVAREVPLDRIAREIVQFGRG